MHYRPLLSDIWGGTCPPCPPRDLRHCTSVQAWQDFLLCKPIDSVLDEEKKLQLQQGNQERHDRYCILPLLVDVTSTLGRLRLPFRGHDETVVSDNKGVFLEVLDLIARWNANLESHLSKSRSKPKIIRAIHRQHHRMN